MQIIFQNAVLTSEENHATVTNVSILITVCFSCSPPDLNSLKLPPSCGGH
jgi:hypothetical protein